MNVSTTVPCNYGNSLINKTTAANYISQVDVFACVSERAERQACLSAIPLQQSLRQRCGCKFRRGVGCYKSDMMLSTRCQQSCNDTVRMLTHESKCRAAASHCSKMRDGCSHCSKMKDGSSGTNVCLITRPSQTHGH